MHFYGFAFSGHIERSESENHTWLEETCLDSSDWDSSNTTDLVHVLEWESEWLIFGSLWLYKTVKSINENRTVVPFHVIGFINHVVSIPS